VTLQRIPASYEGIQVNFCKDPKCPNYGIPAKDTIKGLSLPEEVSPTAGKRHRDGYTVQTRSSAAKKGTKRLKCNECKDAPPMKSNKGIHEEFSRMAKYLAPVVKKDLYCPDSECPNYGVSVTAGPSHYYNKGKSDAKSIRYECRSCGKSISEQTSTTVKQRKADVNGLIFKLLVNKMPFLRICEVAEVSISTLYDKIDFIYKQCVTFSASHEQNLMALNIDRLAISIDRQDYMINWSDTADKRNIIIHSLGSADNASGFIFGLHINLDHEVDGTEIEARAKECGDYEANPPFREHARYWLVPDYESSILTSSPVRTKGKKGSLSDSIEDSYAESELREDIEVFENPTVDTQLPQKGMLIHAEYTLYGHFQFLKALLPRIKALRFYMERESGIRAACLAAFCEEVRDKSCDVFYVRINKDMTRGEKDAAMKLSRGDIYQFRDERGLPKSVSLESLRVLRLEEMLEDNDYVQYGKFKDKWYMYPAPSKNEPEKAVSWQTDDGSCCYSEFQLAEMYADASLYGIDRAFMQIRRRISLLERPIATSSSSGRKWYGYSPYNPAIIAKMLEIFRIYHNYVLVTNRAKRRRLKPGEKKRKPGEAPKDEATPAMRLGLASVPATVHDVLNYMP
jgi:transposase-like protein